MRGSFSLKVALAAMLGGCLLAHSPTALSQPKPVSKRSVPKKQSGAQKAAAPVSSLQSASSTPAPAPQAPVSLLQEPAQRAQIRFNSQGLFIQAENSNLSQILRDIAAKSGMKMEGLGRDERIFGNYGPGTAKDVLGKLLEGTGYNVLMVGETEQGTPRELVLTQRNGSSSSMSVASAPPTRRPEDEDEDSTDTEEEPQQPPQMQAAPQPQQPPNGQTPTGVKTPQQLLEELRRMREQNQNPQQNTEPQQPQ